MQGAEIFEEAEEETVLSAVGAVRGTEVKKQERRPWTKKGENRKQQEHRMRSAETPQATLGAQSTRTQGLSQSKKHMGTWSLQENFHLEKAGSLSAQPEEKNRAFYGMIYFKMEWNQRRDLDSLG